MMRIYSRNALQWKGPELYCGRKKMATIVQDERYASMWRVKYPDGKLSDIVNLTRARDAAMGIALSTLNADAKQSRLRVATAI